MNDFTSYICFALSWLNFPAGYGFFSHLMRWIGGLILVLFNIWVKLDAHRVVKDFAWYWGDFFFLIEQSLTFDGVFEMAPHPMYSVGYAGYYGISLMTASYTVLFVSMIAHAAQFAFLGLVENPHIDKTYNPPLIHKRRTAVLSENALSSTTSISPITSSASSITSMDTDQVAATLVPCGSMDMYSTYFRRDLIVFKNFDIFRSTDIFVALIMFYATVVPLLVSNMGPSFITIMIVIQALLWRIFHSYVLGAVLKQQSVNKFYTKHFIKHGGTVLDAFQSWKSIFNLSNIFEVLGDFGWFYGDFFLEESSNGFVNNPEKVMGHAAFWGMTLICNSWTIFILAMFSQVSTFLFLHFVESPHMRKIYGDKIRKEAGVVKTVKAATILPQKVKDEVTKIREKLGETTEIKDVLQRRTRAVSEKAHEFVEGTTELVQTVVAPKIQEIVSSSKALLENSKEKLFVARTWDEMDAYDQSQYSLKIINDKTPKLNADGIPTYELGEKLTVQWTAPLNHGLKDWIGIYKVSSNNSYKTTNTTVDGRYLFILRDNGLGEDFDEGINKHSGKGDGEVTEEQVVWVNDQEICRGQVTFLGDKLPWFPGKFEFRYHHHNRYNVMAYTVPFEINLESFEDAKDLPATLIAQNLLPYIQHCFSLNEDTMPYTVDEQFVMIDETIARRIVKGIHLMYGIEFAWDVVRIGVCCLRLAEQIVIARRALAPFPTTPPMPSGGPRLAPVEADDGDNGATVL
ncbi:phosphatidylethanolamine N-methyltransferase [Modicella reniformis]|uniref:Phosphatidylethanolamine N-methyltransferase n=1 Tax=Modicella reniformis TaxID=1440133 RepID=A0A9P6IJ60_9FUNG|nr:phosphatidylethanolamine N-methyltransferase [Modicella reniformis]